MRYEKDGLLVTDEYVYINLFMDAVKGKPKMSPIEAELFKRLQYDTAFGIHDHFQQSEGIPLMRLHDCENPLVGSRLRGRLEKFESLEIPNRFGVSWTDFKQMQPWECDELIRVAELSQERRSKIIKGLGQGDPS